MYLPTSYTAADLSKVVDFPKLCTFPTMGWALSGWMAGTAIDTTLLYRHFGICLKFSPSLSLSLSHCLYLIKVFVSFRLPIIADWAFWASTHFAHARTCSLIISLLSSVLMCSLIISTRMSLSFNLCMNCSFNWLSISA